MISTYKKLTITGIITVIKSGKCNIGIMSQVSRVLKKVINFFCIFTCPSLSFFKINSFHLRQNPMFKTPKHYKNNSQVKRIPNILLIHES